MSKVKIGVLVSGSGTDLQSIIDAIEDGYLTEAEIAVVISNKEDAYGLERARKHGIPAVFIEFRKKKRLAFDKEMIQVMRDHGVQLVVMAGFMRLVTSHFVKSWKDNLINIHPALLPSFPGTHAHRDALAWGVKVSGCTIHYVDEEMDHGPIIIQYAVKVLEGDTEDTLGPRVLQHEHNLLPKAVKMHCMGLLKIEGRHVRLQKDIPGYKEWLAQKDGKVWSPEE
jgi:phosphoribosylglycinamide formyltransferase-1